MNMPALGILADCPAVAAPRQAVDATGQSATPSGRLRQGETAHEKYCSSCDEWWPADHEFFSPGSTVGGLYNYCKACAAEWIARKRLAARAA